MASHGNIFACYRIFDEKGTIVYVLIDPGQIANALVAKIKGKKDGR
jgi:hypothetical protein